MSADRPRLGVDHPTVVPRPPREMGDAEAPTAKSLRDTDSADGRESDSVDE